MDGFLSSSLPPHHPAPWMLMYFCCRFLKNLTLLCLTYTNSGFFWCCVFLTLQITLIYGMFLSFKNVWQPFFLKQCKLEVLNYSVNTLHPQLPHKINVICLKSLEARIHGKAIAFTWRLAFWWEKLGKCVFTMLILWFFWQTCLPLFVKSKNWREKFKNCTTLSIWKKKKDNGNIIISTKCQLQLLV
jgi:hypothetical protein